MKYLKNVSEIKNKHLRVTPNKLIKFFSLNEVIIAIIQNELEQGSSGNRTNST